MLNLFGVRTLALAGVLASSSFSFAGEVPLPTEWTFELQCRSSLDTGVPTFNLPFPSSLSSQYVSIGEAGDVAIRAVLAGSEGVFYGQDGMGGMAFTSTTPGDPVWSSSLDLRNGMIAIEKGSFGDGAQLYSTDGSLIHNFPAGGSEGVSGFTGITLTSDGAICYRADSGAIDKIIIDEFIGGVRTQTKVAETGFGGGYSFLFSPEINDSRTIVTNSIPLTGPSRRVVQIDPDLTTHTIAETGPFYNAFVNSTAIAQNGLNAYTARRMEDSIWQVNRGIFRIADGNDPDIQNGSLANFPPVVNSIGWVAFRATDVSNDATALWVGNVGQVEKLVEWDQMIDTDLGPMALGFDFGGFDGRQVINGVIDINDSGQIAFSAFLRNGTIGVFVATPKTVPCPADLNGDGQLNFFDISIYLGLYAQRDPAADINGDGAFNFFDIAAYLGLFDDGCL